MSFNFFPLCCWLAVASFPAFRIAITIARLYAIEAALYVGHHFMLYMFFFLPLVPNGMYSHLAKFLGLFTLFAIFLKHFPHQ